MSRRLVNRAGVSAARSSASRPATAASTTALPDYEPPSCALDESARQALGRLSSNRAITGPYSSEINTALRAISSSVGDLHERLRDGQDRLKTLREKRESRGGGDEDKTPEETRLEGHLDELEREVDDLTLKSEQAMRDLIDQQFELEDEGAVLNEMYTHAATQNGRNDGEGDENGDPTAASLIDAYRDLSARKLTAYTSMSMHQRYAINNEYAGFKKQWHDAMTGEDGPPLPDASRWFRADGSPVMTRPGGAQANDDDSDEDIAVAREVLSINCPLTLRPMDEPYSNRKCKHTFEKAAILDYLRQSGQQGVQCPQTGCSQVCANLQVSYHLL